LWGIFRKHHYLSGSFNKASKVFLVYWEDNLVAMASVLPLPSGNTKYGYRQHRLVVLPDFQGLGIGTKVNDFLGDWYIKQGLKYFIRTSHMRLIRHMESNPKWKPTSHNGRVSDSNGGTMKFNDTTRVCGSFQYMGQDYADKPTKNIVLDREDFGVPLEKTMERINRLTKKYFLVLTTGKTSHDNEIEIFCKKHGIRTELLYIKKNGEYIKKKI